MKVGSNSLFFLMAAVGLFVLGACAPVLIDSPPPAGTVGEPYQHRFRALFEDKIVSTNLPDALLMSDDGIVTGSPKKPGTFRSTVTARNRFGENEDQVSFVFSEKRDVISSKELLIRATDVVDSPRADLGGPWHFKTQLERLAGTSDDRELSRFTIDWLMNWATDQTVNTFSSAARKQISDVIEPWRSTNDPSVLDWTKTPFRLLAIVNRIDLTKFHDPASQQRVKKQGEGRLVYGVLRPDGSRESFTVILEYGLPDLVTGDKTASWRKWAQMWHRLGDPALGGANEFPEPYLRALQEITDAYSQGTHLNQVRSNENALDSLWELREFQLKQGRLRQVTVKQTPDESFDGSGLNAQKLVNFINRMKASIEAGTHEVPEVLPPSLGGGAILAADAPNPGGGDFRWSIQNTNQTAVTLFAFNTCNGCHGGHVQPSSGFLHIRPRGPNQQATLSPFLMGDVRLEPAGIVHNEIEQRKRLLQDWAKTGGSTIETMSIVNRRASRVH